MAHRLTDGVQIFSLELAIETLAGLIVNRFMLLRRRVSNRE